MTEFPLKAVLFVDHEIGFSLLQKVLQQKTLDVLAVVTTKENGSHWWAGVEPLAKEAGLPFYRYDPDNHAYLEQYSHADYFFLLSWKHLMPEACIRIPQKGVINLHYSLLPAFRGVYPVNWALIEGARETGITYHLIDADIDCGTVIMQDALGIAPDDTARSLQKRLDALAFSMFDTLLEAISGEVVPDKKNDRDMGKSRHAYYSAKKFRANDEIDLHDMVNTGDFLDFLRGKTFLPEGRNAYFIDPVTGKKIYVSLVLEEEGA